jgi:AraC-like DNA-binding protein
VNFASPEIQYEANGLLSFREERDGTAQPMPHSHNEIEILLIERGQGTWLIGGEVLTFKARQMVVFWAVRPHQLIKSKRHTLINCLTIPLTVFNEWQLPENISKLLRAGNTIIEPDRSFFQSDRLAFNHWHQDLRSPNRSLQRLALLEIRARLGRLAVHLEEAPGTGHLLPPQPGLLNHGYFKKVSQIADYVSAHFAEPLTVPQIAAAIGMHPTSATKMFKKICGMNLIQYVTQHRILHAQRLLATGDMKILDVALASGYRSASRFYASFKEFCGVSPQEFRTSFDLRKVPLEREAGVWRVGRSRQSAAGLVPDLPQALLIKPS